MRKMQRWVIQDLESCTGKMTGRDLCDHCDGSGYVDDENIPINIYFPNLATKKVCDECGGDGIQW